MFVKNEMELWSFIHGMCVCGAPWSFFRYGWSSKRSLHGVPIFRLYTTASKPSCFLSVGLRSALKISGRRRRNLV